MGTLQTPAVIAAVSAHESLFSLRYMMRDNRNFVRRIASPINSNIWSYGSRILGIVSEQYGPGFDQDLDFLLCYQKYSGQSEFLATPSKDVFN